MLCYQSSRNATTIIRDTWAWITLNRRSLTLVMMPLAVLCLLGQAWGDYNSWVERSSSFLYFFMPDDWIDTISTTNARVTLVRVVLIIGVAVLVVPLLRHYFVKRLSLQKFALRQYPSLFAHSLFRSLAVGVILAVFFAVMLLFKPMLLLLPVLALMLGNVIMGQSMLNLDFRRFVMLAAYGLLIAVTMVVVMVAPLGVMGLMELVESMSSTAIDAFIPGIEEIKRVFYYFIGVLWYMAFGLSIMMFLVSSVLLHGTVNNPEE